MLRGVYKRFSAACGQFVENAIVMGVEAFLVLLRIAIIVAVIAFVVVVVVLTLSVL